MIKVWICMDDIYHSGWFNLWLNYLEIPWNPSRQPYAMGSGDRITSWCDGSVSMASSQAQRLWPLAKTWHPLCIVEWSEFLLEGETIPKQTPKLVGQKVKAHTQSNIFCVNHSGKRCSNPQLKMCEAGYYRCLQLPKIGNRNYLPTSSTSKATSQAKFIAISSHWQGPQAATSQPSASPLVPLVISPVNQISTKACPRGVHQIPTGTIWSWKSIKNLSLERLFQPSREVAR